jgi:multicomponent Na+:H+ antiporter subunit G
MIVLEIILLFLYLGGFFFNLAAVVGIIRMPDVYGRLHSSSKNTTLGSLLIIFGLAIRQLVIGSLAASVKLMFIGLLLMMVTPVASHALARAAYLSGVPLWKGSVADEYARAAIREEKLPG